MDLSSRTTSSRRAPIRGGGKGGVNQAGGWNGGVNQGHVTAGDMDGEWRIISELNFGSKKAMKADEIGQRSSCTEDDRSECGCKLKPVVRVCDQGFDAGRRFLSCPYEGLNSCGYLMWMDDEWQGRSRLVIQKLADDNKKLQIALCEKEQHIQRMKQERIKHNEHRKRREKIDLVVVFVVLASVVMYAVVALLTSGFV